MSDLVVGLRVVAAASEVALDERRRYVPRKPGMPRLPYWATWTSSWT
jgi:hypothetical protein